MKLGIKTGPQTSSITDLEVTHAPFTEVWFDPNQLPKYRELFNYIDSHQIETGLHFWGALADGTWTNLAYPDQALIKETLVLMKKTIDIAALHGYVYVNIHPGCRSKVAIDFQREKFSLLTKPVDLKQSEQTLLNNILELDQYAQKQNVILTVESVPARVTIGWHGQDPRQHPYDVYELPISILYTLSNSGIHIANDFGHTAANMITDNKSSIWEFLRKATQKLSKYTKLVHLGFVIPPFNGTDFHDELDNPIFETENAVPNKNQMLELLSYFKNRDDVWSLVEPKNDHPKNYFLAKNIFETAGVLTE